jgi:hypothetical protein
MRSKATRAATIDAVSSTVKGKEMGGVASAVTRTKSLSRKCRREIWWSGASDPPPGSEDRSDCTCGT